mgnify:CR=1 FL=1
MRTTLLGCVLSALTLASCSSEQSVTEPVRLSDIVNTGCTRSFSAKESRPEYYKSEQKKSPQVSITIDKNEVATFKFADLEANCIVSEFRPSVEINDREIIVVLTPYSKAPTMEADCYCRYDVSFKLSNVASSKYYMKIYESDYDGKYDTAHPVYEGLLSFASNKTIEFEL